MRVQQLRNQVLLDLGAGLSLTCIFLCMLCSVQIELINAPTVFLMSGFKINLPLGFLVYSAKAETEEFVGNWSVTKPLCFGQKLSPNCQIMRI